MVSISRRGFASLLLLTSTGCWGSFGAARALHKWNDGVHPNKFVKWLLFFALTFILPLYELFILGDLFIFNVIEFFTDKNPISSATRDLGDGHTAFIEVLSVEPREIRVTHRKDGKVRSTMRFRASPSGALEVVDDGGKLISSVSEDAFGTISVAREGALPLVVESDEARRMQTELRLGLSPTRVVASRAPENVRTESALLRP